MSLKTGIIYKIKGPWLWTWHLWWGLSSLDHSGYPHDRPTPLNPLLIRMYERYASPHGQPPFSSGHIFRQCYISLIFYSNVNPGEQQPREFDQRPVIFVPATPDMQPPNGSLNSVASHGMNGWLSFGLIPSWQICQSHLIKSPKVRGGRVAQIVPWSSIPYS